MADKTESGRFDLADAKSQERDGTHADDSSSFLVLLSGDRSGEVVPLDAESVVLGRGIGSLPDHLALSRQHARVVPQNGAWVLEDLGSKNGTFHNQAPLIRPVALAHGDLIELGKAVKLQYVIDPLVWHVHALRTTMIMPREPLTGTMALNEFRTHAEAEAKFHASYRLPLSYIACEIDYIDSITSADDGLAVVREAARLLRLATAPQVRLSRTGPMSFALLCRQTGLEQAVAISGNVREVFAEHVVRSRGRRIRMTMSFGVSTLSAFVPSFSALESVANIARDQAVAAGGNKVRSAT